VASAAHRARLRWMFATAATSVVFATASATVCASAVHADDSSSFLGHLNGLRSQHGLAPLSPTGDLTSVAQEHSRLMAAQGAIFHNAALRSQISNWQAVGENVGMGDSAASIDDAFDASPGHFANEINTSYTQVGIGVATGQDGTIFVTLDFRRPQGTAAPVARTPARPAPARKVAIAPTRVPVAPIAPAQPAVPAQAPPAASCQSPSSQLVAGSDPVGRALVFVGWANAMGHTC